MSYKSGISPLNEAQVRKAVIALKLHLEKEKKTRTKEALMEDGESLSCIIQRKKIPQKASIKPVLIDVPHPFRNTVGYEMCLIVKDTDKKRIKEELEKDPVEGLTKVMTLKKLRKDFSRFEDRRNLVGSYDLFLADQRILPYLKTPTGKIFIKAKKQPIPVNVMRKSISNQIRAINTRTPMFVSTGVCMNIRVAHLGMPVDHIVENILVGLDNCASRIGKRWSGIQSVHIKTNESIALPIYQARIELTKLPPTESIARSAVSKLN